MTSMGPEFGYEPTDIDDEVFLSEVPLGLLEKSIETQFNDPGEYRKKDYVQSFITKYEFSKEHMYEEDQDDLDRLHDDFISFMMKVFESYLSIGFVDIDQLDDDDQHELIHLTYRFFIKNMKKNFVTLIMNYINKYKDDLLETNPKKKDVTSLNFKAEIDDDDDIIILSNLGDIIDTIISQDFSVDEFMELCTNEDNCLETEYVKSQIESFTITGNFIPEYMQMVNPFFKVELESKIRNQILKKYPMRESKVKEKGEKK